MHSTLDSLDRLLTELLDNNSKLKTAVIASKEGLIIKSLLPKNIDDAQMALMAATMINMALKAVNEMDTGKFELLTISNTKHNIIILEAGNDSVLMVCVDKNINPRKIYLETREICKLISELV